VFKACSILPIRRTVALLLPPPDKEPLARSPLELVVCQIRFDTNLAVSDGHVALAFHEQLGGRSGSYPKISQVAAQELNLALGAGVPPIGQARSLSGWRFAAEDDRWLVSLMPDFVSLETSAYTTWEDDFQTRLETIVDALAEVIKPALEQRLGLRYVDRLDEPAVEFAQEWQPYIAPELLGLLRHERLGEAVVAARQSLVLRLAEDVNCGLTHGFAADPNQGGKLSYVLDFDIFRDQARAFDAAQAKEAATKFNEYALQLFQLAVTPAFLEQARSEKA
jgi:uncharacterized protein (TIGR04255 family)